MMKQYWRMLLIVLFLAACFSDSALAQEPPARNNKNEARKFDEFGDIQWSDLIARLDQLAIQLQNEPSAKGFIIVYRSRRDLPGLSGRLANLTKAYLVNNRGVGSEQLITVDGGIKGCVSYELWIAPKGTAPMIKESYNNDYFNPDMPLKFDESTTDSPPYVEESPNTVSSGNNLEGFANLLREHKNSKAYIIAYAENFGSVTTMRKFLRDLRKHLVRDYGVSFSRIELVNGGYRQFSTIELWIVPHGTHAPIPTPNQFPKSRRLKKLKH